MWSPERIIAFWIITNLAAVGVYDVVAGTTGFQTVSEVLNLWSKRWPALPLGVGMLIGHLFL